MRNNFKIKECETLEDVKATLPVIKKEGKLKGVFEKESKALKELLTFHQLVGVIGDNDGDGTTATAEAIKALEYLGKKTVWRIPNRYVGSYSLSEDLVDEMVFLGATLIILVDTGIVAVDAVDYAKAMGLDVVILDHHQHLEDELPPADIIVTPYVTDNVLVTKDICAAEVVFFVFRNIIDDQSLINELAELAALATITDCMPPENENRLLIDYLIKRVRGNSLRNYGLTNLLANTSITKATFDYTDVSFGLGPLGNSAGRIDCYAENKFCKLLLSKSSEEVSELTKMLLLFNDKRKKLTEKYVALATPQAEKQINDKFDVVYLPDCPPGVVGIIASKIVEEYEKPTFIFGGEEVLKGSARSFGDYNLIGNIRPILENSKGAISFGGHEGAMGLSFDNVENLRNFKRTIEKEADAPSTESVEVEVIKTSLNLEEVNNFLNEEGYYDCEKPLFLMENVKITYCGLLPQQTQHSYVEYLAEDDEKPQRMMFFFENLDWKTYKDKNVDLVVQVQNKTNGIEYQCRGIILKN